MKFTKSLKLSLIVILALLFNTIIIEKVSAQNKISVEQIFGSVDFYPYTIDNVYHLNDGEHYLVLENGFINEYSYKNGKKERSVLSSVDIKIDKDGNNPLIDEFWLSNDEKKILCSYDTEQIYRRSSASKYFVWDIGNAKTYVLANEGKQRLAEFSPDGNKIAFVANNNLYYKDLTNNNIIQITSDGEFNKIIYGATDWVYEEEFEFSKGFFWSPDGNSIAYYRFDESKVKEYTMELYGDLYPELYKFKYPKAGEDNSIVDIFIYNLNSKNNIKVNTGEETDQYIPWVQWTKDPNKLSVLRMNRLQNQMELLIADSKDGTTYTAYKEENKYYIDLTDFNLYFTTDNKSFIISNETDGYKHIYLYNLIDGTLANQITKGKWEIVKIEGVDEKNSVIYFSAAYSSPINRDICSIKFDGSNLNILSEQKGYNSAYFSKNFKYYFHQWSNANHPPISSIKNIKGKTQITLESNEKLYENIKNFDFQPKEFFSFDNGEGININAWMIKPANFDENKKYPVIFDIYGGPGHQSVLNEWDYMNAWHQLMCANGYIIVSVDNRGTGGRGEEFKKCTYLQLGKYETIDQMAGAKYISNLKYVDESRIGIWGWSFGGYLTLLCMTKGADLFSTGIAVAPVTNWRYYDNIYTERFMRTPSENAEGYDSNSPINYVKKLKGKLLVVHGTADDNVHMQNTMELINKLVNSNKQFEMQLYPNKNHGIYGGYTRIHLFNRITNFLKNNL